MTFLGFCWSTDWFACMPYKPVNKFIGDDVCLSSFIFENNPFYFSIKRFIFSMTQRLLPVTL